jgi:hypothetical protein
MCFQTSRTISPTGDNPNDLGGRTWVKLHRYMANETVTLLTWILFAIAVTGVKKGHYFRNANQLVGFVIFLSTFALWVVGRLLMPPKIPKISNGTQENSRLIPSGDGHNSQQSLSRKECVLLWVRGLFGMGILLTGIWENCLLRYYCWFGVFVLLLAALGLKWQQQSTLCLFLM